MERIQKKKRKGSALKVIVILIVMVFLLTVVATIGIKYASVYVEKTIYPLEHTEYIEKYSEEYRLDKWLVIAVIWVESKFDQTATSHKDARGLMQVTPETGKWAAGKMGIKDFDPEDLYEPDTNIRIGCWYLDNLRTQFDGNLETIIAAYNGGSGNVTKWLKDKKYSDDGVTLKNIPFKETEDYVERVQTTYDRYRELYLEEDLFK